MKELIELSERLYKERELLKKERREIEVTDDKIKNIRKREEVLNNISDYTMSLEVELEKLDILKKEMVEEYE